MEITQSITDRYANYKKEQNMRKDSWLKSIRDIVGECESCGSTEDLTCHHIKKRSEGGNDNPFNLAILCMDCHDILNFAETAKGERIFSLVS